MRIPPLLAAAAAMLLTPWLRAATPAYRNVILADNPIAYWEMDEAAGAATATDSASPAQNGAYQNVTLGQTSAFNNLGTCGQFNGSTSRVQIAADTAFNLGTGDFTVELWAKTPVSTRGDVFNYKNSTDFGIFLNNSGTGSIGGYLNGFLPSYTGTINNWYHIVMTRSAGTARLYVNGVERGTAAAASSFSANAPVFIGANHTGAPGYAATLAFNGWIDEVAMYGTALSATRVQEHYNAAQASPAGSPTVTNGTATNITSSSARLAGTVTDPGTSTPTVTIYYGDNDGGTSTAAWDSSVSAGSQTGAFTADVTGLAGNTPHYFRCFAQNAAGGTWAPSTATFSTPAGPAAVVNVPASGILATSATIGATVTSTGGSSTSVTLFYGTADGGTAAGTWQQSVALGNQTGTATTLLSGLIPGSTYYFRARATNSAGDSWAPSSASFATPSPTPPTVVNQPASSVTIFWATLRGQITGTGNALPDTTIFWGPADGGTNPGAWQNAAPLGLQSGAFSKLVTGLTPSTSYYFRARAVNSAGTAWAPSTASFTTPATSALEAVINEIHCDHEDKTLRVEFIEIYNPGTAPLDLTGWYFDKGVNYTFPSGAVIPAGGYAVVAENPATVQSSYGYAGAYGPWTGTLQAGGETITLRNPAGEVADEVDYGMGFPWPTTGVAPNYSLELINPNLDNSLGGNWRSKASMTGGANTIIAAGDAQWRWRKGNSEASSPISAWRSETFVEDGTWSGPIPFPLGYGDIDNNTGNVDVATTIPDMLNGYRSVFCRRIFNLTAEQIQNGLTLRLRCDDGVIAWINGTELPVRYRATGTPVFDAAGMTITNATEPPLAWEGGITVPNPQTLLHPGANVLALQVFNSALNSSDLFVDAELTLSSGNSPSPGAPNSVLQANAPPAIRQVEHTPANPVPSQTAILPAQAVNITAKATDPQGVQSVTLLYQPVNPGSYIKLEDAAYELPANWTSVAMLDNGQGADLIAGDSIYTATIPGAVQTHRRLVRYRIQATDAAGSGVRVPYADDPAPNFAYFVYGPMPDYTGAINPAGATSYNGSVIAAHTSIPATYPASMLQQVPVYQLITTRQNHVDAQYLPGTTLSGGYRGDESGTATDEQSYPWRGTLVYDGKVYDHIRFRARGGVWRYSMGKNMWKFDMMRGHDFQTKDNFGTPRDTRWKKVNFSSCIQQGDFLNRGEQGLFEAVGFRLFQLSGMPANHTNWVHFRVIEDASESGPSASQYDDDFQGLYLAIEQEDGQFLDEHGLPDGNLYKMEGGTGELNNQGPFQPKDKSDLNAFIAYSTQESWWRTNVQLTNYYNYRSIIDCIHHYDIGDGKNYFFYHYPVDPLNPSGNKWQAAVWDLDLTWADNMYRADSGIAGLAPSGNTTEPFFSRVWPILPLRTELRNRSREILDLLFNQEQTGMLIDELASFIYQPGVPSFVNADRAMWDYNPIMVSANVNSTKAGYGRYYQSAVDDPSTAGVNETLTFPGMMQKMRNYITTRRAVITSQILGDEAQVPATPVITRAGGSTAFPANDLTFTCSAYSSPSARPFAKLKWRLAEITDPNAPGYNRWANTAPRKYEADPANTWESPEITAFSGTFTFPAAAAHVGRTYRARVKYADAGDAAGGSVPRWSHWSAPVTFTVSAPDINAYLSALVVSEVMYNPRPPSGPEVNVSADNDDYEYIVVQNTGPLTLDMSNVRFTKGIDFDFAGSAVTSLAPGQRTVVVKNQAAFSIRYGSVAGMGPIAGQWSAGDSLANGGEQIKLSFGAGIVIRDFTYDDEAPWPAEADGGGYSLVLIAPWTIPDHSLAANWRLSTGIDGAPGIADSQRFSAWKTANGVLSDLADADRDGVSALLEFTLFGNPAVPDSSKLPVSAVETIAGERYLTLTARISRGADDVLLFPERSTDLGAWDGSAASIVPVSAIPDAQGGTTWKWRSTIPWQNDQREYLHLRVQLR